MSQAHSTRHRHKKQVKLVEDVPAPCTYFLIAPVLASTGLIFQLLIGQQNVCSTKDSSTQITSYLIVRGGRYTGLGLKRMQQQVWFAPIFLINTQNCTDIQKVINSMLSGVSFPLLPFSQSLTVCPIFFCIIFSCSP